MQSADLRLGDHIAHLGWLYWPRIRTVSIQRAMCSRSVVVGRVAIKHSEKVPFIAHDDVVEVVLLAIAVKLIVQALGS